MKTMLSKIFGPNWRSSISGILTVVAVSTAMSIHMDPSLVSFLPDDIKNYILGISRIIAVVSGIIFSLTVKDAKVTGGSVASTTEAEERIHPHGDHI
jgi:hypothetical protein